MPQRKIFLTPTYPLFGQNRLFDENDPVLNREGGLLPGIRLKKQLEQQGSSINTADCIGADLATLAACDYYAFDITEQIPPLHAAPQVRMRAFVIMEPPVVAPQLYQALPLLSKIFERVLLHNTDGDGYSLDKVDRSRLYSFRWPQSFCDGYEPYWSRRDRACRFVMVNGLKIPLSTEGELYSARIHALQALHAHEAIDLYGTGWHTLAHSPLHWLPYWRHRDCIQAVYRGPCDSKLDTLSRYDFSVCLENMGMKGYITEKIFDCFYAGTLPVYLGAPDVTRWIPKESFIDLRDFKDWDALYSYAMSMTSSQKQAMREAGRSFLQSAAFLPFYNSMLDIFAD